MSIDYAVWKWKEVPPPITPGLCYLLLAEDVECPEVAPLDFDKLGDQIETAFPVLEAELSLGPSGVLFSTHDLDVVNWFLDLATREGLVFFDPQDERSITEADEREFRRRAEAWEAKQQSRVAEAGLPELRALAAAGDPKALFRLGNCYSFGEGVAQDHAMAFTLFEKSALAGCSDGMFNLAACYRFGEGVTKDLRQAIAWYERAAEADPAFGYFALGEIYANKETGAADPERAIDYLQLAWDHGNRGAYKLLRALGAQPR